MWGKGEGGTEGDLSGQELPWSRVPPCHVQSDGELPPGTLTVICQGREVAGVGG